MGERVPAMDWNGALPYAEGSAVYIDPDDKDCLVESYDRLGRARRVSERGHREIVGMEETWPGSFLYVVSSSSPDSNGFWQRRPINRDDEMMHAGLAAMHA
jgi:hypothetical protein